jgi:hypothetical protein
MTTKQNLACANVQTRSELPRIAVTPDDGAVVTGRTRTRIFDAIKKKELTARKDGKATLIEISELARWVRTMPTIGRTPQADLAA